MKLSLVAAFSENRVIGADGDLPWSLPNDMKRFMSLTLGHCIVMGRKTFDSMDRRPLPRRVNIVLSRKGGISSDSDSLRVVSDLDAAMAITREAGEDELFVIGGEAIYALALPRADCLHLTRIHAEIAGQVHFPEFDEAAWTLVKTEHHDADERHAHSFTFEDWVRG